MCRAAVQRSCALQVRCCVKAAVATMATLASPAEVQCALSPAGLGNITLCRDRQLNALGAEHVEQMKQQLLDWAKPSSGVTAVLLDSSSERSFCSGGDVKAARQAVLDEPYTDVPPDGHHVHRVFQAEYSTLLLTASYQLPLVSLCQGIWMGLGFGLAGFGRYRVVSDGTIFAMPECSIGLWPDVGFAFKAAHMPGWLGLFLGLTGVRLSSCADLLYCGIATHYMPQDKLQAFKQELSQEPGALEALLQRYSQPAPDAPGPLQRLQPVIDKHMQQLVSSWRQAGCEQVQLLHQVMQHLQQELQHIHTTDHQAAQLLQNAINGWAYGSPRSLAITMEHFVRVHDAVASNSSKSRSAAATATAAAAAAAGKEDLDLSTLSGVMHMEYRMAVRQVAHEDFLEGVRAALVDKDRKPAWLGASHHHIPEEPQHKQSRRSPPGNRFSVQDLFKPLAASNGAVGQHLFQ